MGKYAQRLRKLHSGDAAQRETTGWLPPHLFEHYNLPYTPLSRRAAGTTRTASRVIALGITPRAITRGWYIRMERGLMAKQDTRTRVERVVQREQPNSPYSHCLKSK